MRSPKMLFPAAFLVIALLVSGCAGKSEPTPNGGAPTPSTGAPSGQASTPNGGAGSDSPGAFIPGSEKGPAQIMPIPQLPAAAQQNNEAGAVAYVDYLFKLLTYTAVMRDSEPLMEQVIAGAKCVACSGYQKVIDEITEKNRWISDRKSNLKILRTLAPSSKYKFWEIQVRYSYPETTAYEAGKVKKLGIGEAENKVYAVAIVFSSGKWGVKEWFSQKNQ